MSAALFPSTVTRGRGWRRPSLGGLQSLHSTFPVFHFAAPEGEGSLLGWNPSGTVNMGMRVMAKAVRRAAAL